MLPKNKEESFFFILPVKETELFVIVCAFSWPLVPLRFLLSDFSGIRQKHRTEWAEYSL